MPTSIGTTGITFPDATVQTTAFSGSGGGGFNGATTTSSAVDITLTSASTQTQVVTMTATSKFVILPNATTLSSKGGPIYIIQNKGTVPFGIKDGAGNVIFGQVTYGQSVQLLLLTNATTAGTWSVQSNSLLATIGPVNVSAYASIANLSVVVAGLSATQAVMVYPVSNVPTAVVLTISGTSVSYGTPLTMTTMDNAAYMTIVALSSTQVVIGGYSSGSYYYVAPVSVSGTTLTQGTGAYLSLTNPAYVTSTVNTSTTGLFGFVEDNGSNALYKVSGFTVASNAITFGAASTVATTSTPASNISWPSITRIASGFYVTTYTISSAQCYVRTITNSGGASTLGTQYTAPNVSLSDGIFAGFSQAGYAASSTCAVFSSGFRYFIANTSGTTISGVISGASSTVPVAVSNLYNAGATPFGSSAVMFVDNIGNAWAYGGSSTQYSGTAYLGNTGLTLASSVVYYGLRSAQLDSSTCIVVGNYQGYVSIVIIKVV